MGHNTTTESTGDTRHSTATAVVINTTVHYLINNAKNHTLFSYGLFQIPWLPIL